jgi:hypothetical protein
MKKLSIICFISAYALAVRADESTPVAYNNSPETGVSSPKIEWVKTEIQKIVNSNELISGERLGDILTFNTAEINESSVVIATGHFTSTQKNQYIITVPGTAITGRNLGWETNLWLLVEKTDGNDFKTIATLRGDVAYQNSLVDVDGDGLQEISMVNRTGNQVSQSTYKLYSFKNNKYVYQAETVDNWSNNRIAKRKHLAKGELLYNILQVSYTDTDGDGKTEIVETWINFNYNGGRRIATIEQKKSMTVVTNIVRL